MKLSDDESAIYFTATIVGFDDGPTPYRCPNCQKTLKVGLYYIYVTAQGYCGLPSVTKHLLGEDSLTLCSCGWFVCCPILRLSKEQAQKELDAWWEDVDTDRLVPLIQGTAAHMARLSRFARRTTH